MKKVRARVVAPQGNFALGPFGRQRQLCSSSAPWVRLLHAGVMAAMLSILAVRAHADGWNADPAVNTPICTEDENQTLMNVASDGVGGAIFTWYDWRTSSDQGYGQRLNAMGEPLWGQGGLALMTGSPWRMQFTSDAKGGLLALSLLGVDWRLQ